jgi:hypothetical protein
MFNFLNDNLSNSLEIYLEQNGTADARTHSSSNYFSSHIFFL